jgi:hypothetical protein
MARRTPPKDRSNKDSMLGRERGWNDDVPIPHPYQPIAGSPQKFCSECFAVPTDATFAEHHATATNGGAK